ncbi:MAG: ASKHA domain-containing protein [Thermodesulfobacteriota bacterium]
MSAAIVFQPMGRRAQARPGQTLLQAAQDLDLGLEATCGGKGLCGRCRVRPSHPAPATPEELRLLGPAVAEGWRLACRTSLPQGGPVWVPPDSLRRHQVILTAGAELDVELEPAVRQHQVEVPAPELDHIVAGRERLAAALAPITGRPEPDLPLAVLRSLPAALAAAQGRVAAALWQDRRLLEVSPDPAPPVLGLAVDLGTTTVVAYLCDLADGRVLAVKAAMNPQVAAGDDVISRIAQAGLGAEALASLGGQAVECVNALTAAACREAGFESGRILECVLVGNTAMHHLFLGLDPAGLASAPYAPVAGAALDIPAAELGLGFHSLANLHVLPVKAGFVGADTVAVALAVAADRVSEPTLILDLGTNGEMILAAPGRMLCCSTAAGPAFEGGHIGQGMRGAPGAVDQVRLDPASLEPTLSVIGGGRPLGLCGSGIVSAVAALVAAGLIPPSGGFDPDRDHPRLRQGQEGLEFVLAWAAETAHGRDLCLSAKDLAEVQLAKGAVAAGVRIMLDRLGLEKPARVLLAGAFGNYLDPAAALAIGLFPDVGLMNVRGVGNAAGGGAILALLNRGQRARAKAIAQAMEYLELAALPEFPEAFVEGMFFPEPRP